ncbi:acyl-CoA oxidase [Dictyostelium discoideum AX4]|uniref:Acyl-coenzyme A oxidase n=2 Tax=Dictyostelium discoideum TaxID=44689 RepID=Q54RB0_DICDI|nr:acyl-CoA oxidase [Dictyostelium discoideum AX4]EAL65771.1 acyl-CoA oxidase [Dictyostelium discoideum AX4]|eukprot:XP_639137.1 acyl-CoA oxidase [Dictyostelium discoideum AX4]
MDKATLRRIDNTLKHLTKVSDIESLHKSTLKDEIPNVKLLRSILDGEFHFDRDRLRELFQSSNTFNERFLMEPLSTDEHREQTLQACLEIIQLQLVQLNDMEKNPKKFLSWFESISMCDPSVSLKFAVQYNLWGGTILFLGTKKHHDKYLSDIATGKLLGVFGLTELGHGSNVNGLETTATYDRNTQEFIINSPTWESQKYWPGNISKHGKMATIFARLLINDNDIGSGSGSGDSGIKKDMGIHAFVVQIRSESTSNNKYGELLPGVTVRDISLKNCYNGIDNGGLSFNNVRIPRENMLDRFSRVDANGKYHCDLPSNRHFAMTMSVFFIGRLCLSLNALSFMKSGLSIAIGYSINRHQFSTTTKSRQEIPILVYSTTQLRLIPYIARAYALDLAHKMIADLLGNSTISKEVIHSYSSGFKAITSWTSVESLQLAREVLGGQGLRLCNRIPMLLNHADLITTGEGDNTVLCQQVTKFLLAKYHATIKSAEPSNFKGELSYINHLTSQPPTTSLLGGNGGTDNSSVELNSIAFHQWLLEKREYILIKTLHSRLYGRMDDELIEPNTERWFSNWNQSLPLCKMITKANVDRLTQSFFLHKINQLASTFGSTDTNTITMLKNLCRLDTLFQIQKDLGFFINNGLLIGESKWIQLQDEITHLSRDISPHSHLLTEAFAIPNKFNPLQNSIE